MLARSQVRYFWGLGVPQKGFFLWREAPPLGALRRPQAPSPPYRPLSLPRMPISLLGAPTASWVLRRLPGCRKCLTREGVFVLPYYLGTTKFVRI